MGHMVVGALKRVADDVFEKNGEEVHFKQCRFVNDVLHIVKSK